VAQVVKSDARDNRRDERAGNPRAKRDEHLKFAGFFVGKDKWIA